MRTLLLSIAALAVTLAAVPATASAKPCGAVNVVPITWKVLVSKRGPVTCHRARAVTVRIYEGRGKRTAHCLPGHPNCARSDSYMTQRGLPGWRYWTGAGGGAAWRGRSRVVFEWGSGTGPAS